MELRIIIKESHEEIFFNVYKKMMLLMNPILEITSLLQLLQLWLVLILRFWNIQGEWIILLEGFVEAEYIVFIGKGIMVLLDMID